MLGLSLRAGEDASAPLNSVLRNGGKLQPRPPPLAGAESRDRARVGRVPGAKVEKAERSSLGAGEGERGEPGQARGTGGGTTPAEPATNTAWSPLGDPHTGTLVEALANSAESLSRLQNPQPVPTSSLFATAEHTQHPRAHAPRCAL